MSTGSVYDLAQAPETITEAAPRLAPERGTEEITEATYGPLKVACEDDVLTLWGPAATIVRPGIVAGPHDPTDRFTWWVRRAARGGRMAFAAPARPAGAGGRLPRPGPAVHRLCVDDRRARSTPSDPPSR